MGDNKLIVFLYQVRMGLARTMFRVCLRLRRQTADQFFAEKASWDEAILRAENERLRGALRRLYEPARVAVNQIICMGGKDVCQPCENREKLAEALREIEATLGAE